MTWSIQASGHPTHPDAATAADLERQLHGQLANVLSDPRYGVSASQFTGTAVSGTPGIPEPEPVPPPAADAAAAHAMPAGWEQRLEALLGRALGPVVQRIETLERSPAVQAVTDVALTEAEHLL